MKKHQENGLARPRAAFEPVKVRRITLAMVRDAFYDLWSTEDYYHGDGSEYESRFLVWLELEKKKLSDEHSEYEKLVFVWKDLMKRKSADIEENEYAMAPAHSPTKKRKNRGPGDDEQGRVYNCSVCNEPFHSYRALGGHMTVHRSSKQRISSTASGEKVSSAKRHVCRFCRKEFKSGPALGGHMKEHWHAAATRTIASAGTVPVLDTGLSASVVPSSASTNLISVPSSSGEDVIATSDDNRNEVTLNLG